MRNRLPTYPGRVHLAPVEGQANVFDLTRADEPQDPGTPLNKGTLLSDDVEALIWGAAADRTPNDAFGKVSELYQHWWAVADSVGETTYVHSPERNAYPDSGTVDGLTYKYLGVPFENAMKGNVETGSYTGTGTYGKSNKNSLTFSFRPTLIIIFWPGGDYTNSSLSFAPLIMVNGFNGIADTGNAWGRNTASWDDKTVSWYADGANHQKNESGRTYCYIAIG